MADRQLRDQDRSVDLRSCESYCQLLIENSLDVISVLNSDGVIEYQSPSVTRILGYDREELTGRPAYELIHPEDREKILAISKTVTEGRNSAEGEFRFRHKNGAWRYLEAVASVFTTAAGNVGFVINSRDITDKRELEEQLLYEALHDSLTGLPNRNYLLEQLRSTVIRAKKKQNYLFGVIALGLDRFKIVNESLGFHNGDKLLQELARRLLGCVRLGDIAARIGGDRFTLLLREVKDVNDVLRVAERIQDTLGSSFMIDNQEVFTTATLGIALSDTALQDEEELLRNADIAMHRAKKASPGSWQIYHSEMYEDLFELLQLEFDLRRAVERQEFTVHYLPTISLATGRMVGAEALVRWQHPERGLVFPDQFIGAAEETRLICAIGEQVLRQACAQLKEWHELGHTDLRIAVNFSVDQFRNQDLPALVRQVLTEYGIRPENFEMEITESIIMKSKSVTMLQELHDMGIKISIDDFGTGYSSLSYLKKIPSHVLKIDKSFIRGINTDQEDTAIAKTIILMAHSLGLQVLAEGVETKEQLDMLKQLECDEVQGYYFSKPRPGAEITQMIEQEKTDKNR